MDLASFPNSLSLVFVEELHARYLEDPMSVDPEWRRFFESLVHDDGGVAPSVQLGPTFHPRSVFNPVNGAARGGNGAALAAAPSWAAASAEVSDVAVRQDRVDALVRAYRVR